MNQFVVVSLALLAFAGCARRIDRPAPTVPPPRAEMIPLPPVTRQLQIWRPGDWDWSGDGYVWTPGHYVPRGAHGSLWLPGHWQQAGEDYRWVPGRWL